MIKAVMRVTTAHRDPVPMTSWAAPLGEEVEAFAAPELALRALVVVVDAAEVALALALDIEAEADDMEEAEAEAEEEDMDIEFPLPVIDIAPDPVKVPSAILLVVTAAVLESELLYHG
jgi:hypothetical protein